MGLLPYAFIRHAEHRRAIPSILKCLYKSIAIYVSLKTNCNDCKNDYNQLVLYTREQNITHPINTIKNPSMENAKVGGKG